MSGAARASGPWAALLRAAIVGTQREAFRAEAAGDAAFDALLAAAPHGSPEAALLRTAAVLGVARRAGALVPDLSAVDLEPAPDEHVRRCSREAAHDLARLLDGAKGTALLPEWLSLAAAARVRVPEEALPRLLTLGKSRRDVRPALAAVLGERGRWLARQDAGWAYAAGGDEPEREWQEGDPPARARALRRLRERDPHAARELLTAGWEREVPAQRAAFVEACAVGLSLADEPFLEALLDERRKDVRGAAAALLGRLAQSRFAARAIARAGRFVRVESRFLRAPALHVDLPPDCDVAMERDGIDRRPATGFGERAWWLLQLVARVPPAHWSAAFGLEPAAFLEACARNEFAAALHGGLAQATAAYGDDRWRSAWIERAAASVEALGFALTANEDAPASALRRAALLQALRAGSGATARLALTFPGPWDEEFSRTVARFVARAVSDSAEPSTRLGLHGLIEHAALHVLPETPRLEEEWPEKAPYDVLVVALDELRDTIRFRAAFRARLKAETPA